MRNPAFKKEYEKFHPKIELAMFWLDLKLRWARLSLMLKKPKSKITKADLRALRGLEFKINIDAKNSELKCDVCPLAQELHPNKTLCKILKHLN